MSDSKNIMSIDELILEYEEMLGLKLTQRDRTIFIYAYLIGREGLNHKEDE